MPPGSLQGEHIFNALGDLSEEIAAELSARINASASQEKRDAATSAIHQLRIDSRALKLQRNRDEFRTGPRGDITNANRYSQFLRLREALSSTSFPQIHHYTQKVTPTLIGYWTIWIGTPSIEQRTTRSARNSISHNS